jgi:hypothetical protein
MVSNRVPAPQVAKVAMPDADGVNAKTFSGASDVPPRQDPESVLTPDVVPLNVPPWGGIAVKLVHASATTVIGICVKLLFSSSSGIFPNGSTFTRSV